MTYGSVASGIEAATVAWEPLGWKAAWFSEIDKFPSAVLAHHYPGVPNLGDMNGYKEWPDGAIDILVGGTPCQSFSVAGLRRGLDDPRGSLMLVYLAIARRYRPAWIVWENVPGVLSSNGGRDFGTFLGGLAELGYGFAYAVLDAQWFGCAFPRPRVFVLGYRGDWRPPAAALFERESFDWDQTRDRTEAKTKGSAAVLTARGGMAHDDRSNYVLDAKGIRTSTPLEWERALGFPDEYTAIPFDGRQRRLREKAQSSERDKGAQAGDESGFSVRAHSAAGGANEAGSEQLMRDMRRAPYGEEPEDRSRPRDGQGSWAALSRMQHQATSDRGHGLCDAGMGVPRRERIAADGPRYRALGNSMAVPVMRWIGERIERVLGLIE